MELCLRTEVPGKMRYKMTGERLESWTWGDAEACAHQPRNTYTELIHARMSVYTRCIAAHGYEVTARGLMERCGAHQAILEREHGGAVKLVEDRL